MRGEHVSRTTSRHTLEGSSPHARGALLAFLKEALELGIIPACAGSTKPPILSIRYRRDHPRMRGEHLIDDDEYPL